MRADCEWVRCPSLALRAVMPSLARRAPIPARRASEGLQPEAPARATSNRNPHYVTKKALPPAQSTASVVREGRKGELLSIRTQNCGQVKSKGAKEEVRRFLFGPEGPPASWERDFPPMGEASTRRAPCFWQGALRRIPAITYSRP